MTALSSDETAKAQDARRALAQLQHEADVLRRAAQETRRDAERCRLAAFTRTRHRP